ncbi:MAG: hypothetical protein AAGG01_21130 [Planctomycetota bacterium]
MKNTKALLSLAAAFVVLIYLTVNTRIGVHVVLDMIQGGDEGSVSYDASSGPLEVTRALTPIQQIALPAAVEQPSGIQHRRDLVYISTDQGELFVLNGQFDLVSEAIQLIGGPLLFKQGLLEAIELVDEQLLAVGEFGAIRVWEPSGDSWRRIDDIALPPSIADGEFSGIARLDSELVATSEDEPVIVDLRRGEVHELDFGSHLKDGADVSALEFSGLASANGLLYVLTETHSSVLVVDPDGYRVAAVYGIKGGPVADLAVRDGRAYVVVDHNYTEPRPPMYVYELPSLLDGEGLPRSSSPVTK